MSAEIQGSTPAAKWRENGEPDPHGSHYDGERAQLCLGKLTDDELANAVYLHDHRTLNVQAVLAGEPSSIALLTAAKERIRWLSRSLIKATTQAAIAIPAAHEPITEREALSLHAVYDWINQQDKPLVARELEPILAKLASLGYLGNVIGGEYIKAKP